MNLDLNRFISVWESKIQRNKYWVITCYFEWICLINFSLTKNVQYLTYTTKISNNPWHFHHAIFYYNTNFHFSVEYVIVSFLVGVCRFFWTKSYIFWFFYFLLFLYWFSVFHNMCHDFYIIFIIHTKFYKHTNT